MDCREVQERLDAYLDRELSPAEVTAVRDHLATCADCRAHLAARQSLSTQVRQAPYYTAPAALKERLAQERTKPRWTTSWIARVAAVLLIALVGTMLVLRWRASGTADIDAMASAVADSHVRALMGDHLFDVRSTDQHTVKPWFLGKLDFSPPVQDLAAIGYPLAGGRLEYLAGRPAAALVYMRGQHVINLFIWPDSSADVTPTVARSIRGFHVRHWTRAGMSFWAVSDLNDTELDEFVKALQA